MVQLKNVSGFIKILVTNIGKPYSRIFFNLDWMKFSVFFFGSSEDRGNNDVEVEIIEEDSTCKLRVKKANIDDHDGLWDVEITGKCNEEVRKGITSDGFTFGYTN